MMEPAVFNTLDAILPSDVKVIPDFELTDMGNADRMAHRHGGCIRYCFIWGKWLAWDGGRWHEDNTGKVRQYAKETVRAISDEANACVDAAARAALLKHARASQSASRLRAMLELMQDQVPVEPSQLDVDAWLLNCRNGIVDLRTGNLLPHEPERFLTKMVNAEYQSDAIATVWKAFLGDIFGNNGDVIEFIQRAVGYALTASVDEQVFFVLYGTGANGKSTFTNTLQSVLGDYAMAGAPTLLIEPRGAERHPTELADLMGKRFVVYQESGSGSRLAETQVKQLTGSDPIKARYMRQDFFTFDPTHKIFLATNHRPDIRGTDHAIWRRIRLIPFEVTIPERKRDPDLPRKLRAEADGILAWAVEGCRAWQDRGLNPPEPVLVATNEYRSEQDILAAFIEECCFLGNGGTVGATDLYCVYKKWSESRGEHPRSQRRFGLALRERGLEHDKDPEKRTVIYKGIALRQPELGGAR